MKNFNQFILNGFFSIIICLSFSSCEEEVNVDLDNGTAQLTVDAVITNKPGSQTIKLTKSTGYFNNSFAPAVIGATVKITDLDNGTIYEFLDADNDGKYIWTPQNGESFGQIGNDYALYIKSENEEFEAFSTMFAVPQIDSIYLEKRKKNTAFNQPEGIYAELFARDLKGVGNCYWIRTYKNNNFLNKPEEIGLAFDAAFSAGNPSDGLVFIKPIREYLNPVNDEDEQDKPPYVLGDSIYAELYSITPEMWFYMNNLKTQLLNGGLFATPAANLPCNISNKNPKGSKAVGFFSVSAVAGLGVKVQENLVRPEKE
ncbi:MAG: hypothetical protein OHK0038_26280 [Flammeovirgaceae bacterium]